MYKMAKVLKLVCIVNLPTNLFGCQRKRNYYKLTHLKPHVFQQLKQFYQRMEKLAEIVIDQKQNLS